MRKLFFIVSVLAFGMALNAQSLSTGIQYVGAAAQANAAQRHYELTTATEDVNTRLYHNIFLKLGLRIGG